MDAIGILCLEDLQRYQKKLQDNVKTRLVGLSKTYSCPTLWTWLREYATLHCSWRNFFESLRLINLSQLADKAEAYLTGAPVEMDAYSNVDESLLHSEELKEVNEETGKSLSSNVCHGGWVVGITV